MTGSDSKERLQRAFLKLIEEKPFAKITVNDIVEEAGVHRNTFYYHYQSIPALLNEICQQFVERAQENYKDIRTPADCVLPMMRISKDYKQAIQNVYFSEARNLQLACIRRIGKYSIESYIDNLTDGKNLDRRDREIMIRIYTAGIIGIWTEWVEEGMKAETIDDLLRMDEIRYNTTLELLVKKD